MKTNLEIIQSIYLGDAEQNAKNLQAILAPEFEWREAAGFPYTGTFNSFEEVVKNPPPPPPPARTGFPAHLQKLYHAREPLIPTGSYPRTYKTTHPATHPPFAPL